MLENYLELIKAKLSKNGVAVLAYGKLETPIFGDYVEINPKIRDRECTLYIRPSKWKHYFGKTASELFPIQNVIFVEVTETRAILCSQSYLWSAMGTLTFKD